MTDQVSRPVQILLAVTVLFAAVWFVALRPKSGEKSASAPTAPPTKTTSTPAAPGVAGLGRAIDKAHGAAATSDAEAGQLGAASDAAASGADPSAAAGAAPSGAATSPGAAAPSGAAAASGAATSPGAAAPSGAAAASGAATSPASPHSAAPSEAVGGSKTAGADAAARALAAHRVLAILFHNPRAADDRAVLRAFHSLGGRGVTFVAAPLSRLAAFPAVTSRVAVTGSPTLVTFDRAGRPATLVGFSDPALMQQRLADARAGH